MARVVSTSVFVGSALPIVLHVLLVHYFVFLNWWVQIAVFVLNLLPRVFYQVLERLQLGPIHSCINDVLVVVQLDKG